MKVLFAAISLWAVAVFALRGDRTRFRLNEVVDPRNVESFRPGQTYRFQLDTQISSGMASVSEQHAVTRIQSQVELHFQSERQVTLRLNDIIFGTLNQEIAQPERVQPMEMFKKHEMKPEEEKKLELPCTFEYVEGLVENIKFHSDDEPWSKNIKKSVLNMIQLNLKRRTGAKVQLEKQPEWNSKHESDYETKLESTEPKMFVLPEITLEGECQVSYTLNKVSSNNNKKYNSYYDNEMSREENSKVFNVTKTIDFKQCEKIADIRYGPKVEKPCDNCTSPEELEEQKLERSTILRHVVVGTPEKYGLQKVELVSHYLFKTLNVEEEKPMHTIVAGELTYLEKKEGSSRREEERESRPISSGKEETLMYSTEWDQQEKEFYMYGDEQFPQSSPFKKLQGKVDKVEKMMNKLITLWSEKTKGIETEATIMYTRVVELLRMCNLEELREIYQIFTSRQSSSSRLSETEQLKAEELLVDAMANAGTHNTIKVLVEKILKRDITTSRAVRILSQLKDLPAPSEKIQETLTNLCQHEVISRFQSARQACWLTTGAVVGELCNEQLTVEDAFEQKKGPLCQTEMKKKWIKTVMTQYSKVETRYEKVLLLKALGNAGLDLSVFELEKIIRDIREDPLVRMQAIDSLRRLRAVMPEKIHRILMPVFQDVRERPEIRMACISQILATVPEKHVLDLIGHALIREPSRQVKSYIYTAMKFLSDSPVRMEKEMSQHLKALLKMAGITEEDEEEILRGSRYIRIPIFSQAKKEGMFLDLESMVGPDNVLPKHLHANLDSFLNGIFKKSNVEISFTQEDLEKWYENIMNAYYDYYYGSSSSNKKSGLRAFRRTTSSSEETNEEARSIFSSLSVKRRNQRLDSDRNDSPYGMFSFRMGDVDYAIVPFEEEMLFEPIKKIVADGQRPTMRDFEKIIEYLSRPFVVHSAMNIMENSVKIPTSMGLPIRMVHVLPVLASVEGQVKPQISSNAYKLDIKVHPMMTLTHLKRIEIWTPIRISGVETSRTLAVNIPLRSELNINTDRTFKWSIQVPEQKHRLISFHALPVTFITEPESIWQLRLPLVKSIENQELMHRSRHIEKIYGQENFELPLHIKGELHYPQRMSYEDIVNVLLASENHLVIDFSPNSEAPREIVIEGECMLFNPSSNSDSERSQHREHFKSFYSKSKFDDEMDKNFEDESSEEDDERMNKFLDRFEPRKMYEHQLKLKVKTVGGRKAKQAQVEIRGSCDDNVRFCKARLEILRSPLFEESRDWTFKAQGQALMPEYEQSWEDYEDRRRDNNNDNERRRDNSERRRDNERKMSDKQQKLVSSLECEWGSERKQTIRLNINGEKARNQEWNQKINEIEKRIDGPKLREQMKRKIAFLNKYDLSAQHTNLEPSTINFFNWASTILKNWNMWNTQVELKNTRGDSKQIVATMVIDPLTHEHMNITLKTPMEIIRITPLSLPMKIKPFKLVKPGQSSIESFTDMVSSYATESRPECKVDSRKVNTFDDVTFKAPLTKCYTVLAKDCSSERPRFAVMMKKQSDNEKKLKMISGKDIIEVETENNKLHVKINGKRESDHETLRDYGVEKSEEMVRINTKDVTVRFDGEQVWIKLSPFYKNRQCGLCGHYDDNTEDEYRMNDNENAKDIKSFHKSYSLQNDECRSDLEDTHRREEYEPITDSYERYERDEEYQQRRNRINENDETEPVERTEVIEHSHKVCFSLKPVKTCPQNSYPKETKEQKVSFTCYDRSSTEARQLLRQVRRYNEPVEVPSEKASFVQQLSVPTTCVVY